MTLQTPETICAGEVGEAQRTEYFSEYRLHLSLQQKQTMKRWYGSVRCVRNNAKSLCSSDGTLSSYAVLLDYIADQNFLRELPQSAIAQELLSVLSWKGDTGWASRKHDVQSLIVSGKDFELTPRAAVTVAGLGELDVDFNEGVPEQFPTKIELLQDPAGDATIRIYYAGEFPNV